MTDPGIPSHYVSIKDRFPEAATALEELGRVLRERGPLAERTAHLVQMAAAGAVGSEGGVRSHARRALAAGASLDEVYQVALLLVTTIGFPRAAAMINWVDTMQG
jgi:4-carboxymuconolactone decarboxylase